MGGGGVAAAQPRPEAIEGWQRYVTAVESRRAEEVKTQVRFLVMDTEAGGASDRRAVLSGALVVRSMEAKDPSGGVVGVPSAMAHHWRGAVFLPGVSLERLLTTLETEAPPTGPEVLRSAVLARGPSFMKVYLRLQRTKFVTVVYNTEHDVRFVRNGPAHARSMSVATRIAEVESPGTAAERERASGHDRGFLWRLNAYWRYEAAAVGVIAECESISLSRGVPVGLQTITGPIIGSIARESMERTLESLRAMATKAAGPRT